MKLSSCILCCALSVLGVGSAAAKSITVRVTGHVTAFNNATGALGQIVAGEVITGTYTYDTNTANLDTTGDGNGHYQPSVPPANTSISLGSLLFQSVATSQFDIDVRPVAPALGGTGYFTILATNGQSLASGASVSHIGIAFADPYGQFPSSNALPTGAPILKQLNFSAAHVDGYLNGGAWEFDAQIDSVQFVPPAIEVIPSTGDILPQQHFDAALLLPPGAPIATMQASVGGNPIPLFYPGSCQLVAPNSVGRAAILCPSVQLPPAGVDTQPLTILWQVVLTDGTQLNQTVQWTVTP